MSIPWMSTSAGGECWCLQRSTTSSLGFPRSSGGSSVGSKIAKSSGNLCSERLGCCTWSLRCRRWTGKELVPCDAPVLQRNMWASHPCAYIPQSVHQVQSLSWSAPASLSPSRLGWMVLKTLKKINKHDPHSTPSPLQVREWHVQEVDELVLHSDVMYSTCLTSQGQNSTALHLQLYLSFFVYHNSVAFFFLFWKFLNPAITHH